MMAMIIPAFGPLAAAQIELKHPHQTNEYMNYCMENAIALAEDALHYCHLNQVQT